MEGARERITYAYLETSNFCNIDCRFCNRRDVVRQPRHMPLNEWDTVLEKLSSEPVREAKLMGLGEPFLHPDFYEICRRFRVAFPSAFTITATNCQHGLNGNFIKTLPSIDLLYLSVDGYGENYERDRKGANWPRLLKFLDELSTIDRGKTRIAINFVVTGRNYPDIEKINRLVSERYGFIEEVRLNIAQWWGEDQDIKVEFTEGLYETLIRYKKNVKGKAPWGFHDCFWPKSGFYMDVSGDVRICCLNTSASPVGNIFKSSLDELLESPKRRQVAVECRQNSPGVHCRRCDYKKLSPALERVFKG